MTQDQIALFGLFAVLIAALVWGRLRHDIVAFAGLLAGVLLGLVPAREAFSGFAHPAVVTVALVLVVSAGLMRTGAIHLLGRYIARPEAPVWLHLLRMGGVGAALSAVMNNVTALALLMPLDIQTARKAGRAGAPTLMPLAFATIPSGGLPLMVLLMSCTYAAMQISPAHICLFLCCDYFKISIGSLNSVYTSDMV